MKSLRFKLLSVFGALYFVHLLLFSAALVIFAEKAWLFSVAALAALGFSIAVILKIARSLTERLGRVVDVADRISAGELDKRVYLDGRDEVTEVGKAVNRMATSRQEQLREISANRDRLETILSTMVEGVIVFDEEGKAVLANPAAKTMLGLSKISWTGRSDLELVRNAELHEKIKSARQEKKVQEHELKTVLPEKKVLSASIVPLKAGVSGRAGVLAVFHDVTRLRRLEEIRADFAANVSHEMRTPLTAIRGYAETLLDGAYQDPEVAIRFLKIIHRESERLNNLIEDVLMLSQIESGRSDIQFAPVDVAALIAEVLESLTARFGAHKLKQDLASDLPPANGDRGLLGQALFNLLDNSLKYTPAGGEITLGAAGEANSIRIFVADTGIGIPSDEQTRIFERFYRVDRARSRRLGGTGLGLSIVKHIVETHHGQLKLESREGQGTTVSLYVPVYTPGTQ
ncbi:MAG: HAMP domain-containing protein [Dethiobacter sp.]|nr:HAMP domain-containing protein [Dethiobacter sp.]MCL5981972.1 ATP-binding protein [Bacillota bacterium]